MHDIKINFFFFTSYLGYFSFFFFPFPTFVYGLTPLNLYILILFTDKIK